jgi:N-acetylneuraminic acid mutarotase
MSRKILALVLVAGLLPAIALAGSSSGRVPGTWRMLAPQPYALPYGGHVWTGKQLIVFGRKPVTRATYNPSVNAALAYDPSKNAWRTLAPPADAGIDLGCCKVVWTGGRMLVPSRKLSYDPQSGSWRRIKAALPEGIVVWTGREAIGWGGGCCGDATADGAAYSLATNATRALPRSPLAPSQDPIGAWDGHRLLLFVGGYDPEGKPYPARLARGAAYDPSTNGWRRIAPVPVAGPRVGAGAVWTGKTLVVAGAGPNARSTVSYDPRTSTWRRLASMPAGRPGADVLWTGSRVVVWDGTHAGLSYDPAANQWATLARPPLRAAQSVAWTGHSLIAFGGIIGSTAATGNQQVWLRGVAAFTPAARPS